MIMIILDVVVGVWVVCKIVEVIYQISGEVQSIS